jgi:hypothetical protein
MPLTLSTPPISYIQSELSWEQYRHLTKIEKAEYSAALENASLTDNNHSISHSSNILIRISGLKRNLLSLGNDGKRASFAFQVPLDMKVKDIGSHLAKIYPGNITTDK